MTEPTPHTTGTPDGESRPPREVAIIAAGTIGISWTALFLAHGARVRVFDTRDDLGDYVRASLQQIAPTLASLGLPARDLASGLTVSDSLDDAVAGAEIVQENGPERLELKQDLLASIERAAGEETLLLSSTSSIPATPLAAKLTRPERLLVGHPFNPPHLVPLVEVVPGDQTDAVAVDRAVEFYVAMGKRPVVVHKEIDGFVANRLQAALFRESIYLVEQGVVDVAELDRIVTSSIGPRWAGEGPFLSFHLGGGAGGLGAFFEHLGPALDGLWRELGSPTLDRPTVELITGQASRAFVATPLAELERERDGTQLAVLAALASVSGNASRNGKQG
jgi:ketoreductase RED1